MPLGTEGRCTGSRWLLRLRHYDGGARTKAANMTGREQRKNERRKTEGEPTVAPVCRSE
jgi:hypothetical protein